MNARILILVFALLGIVTLGPVSAGPASQAHVADAEAAYVETPWNGEVTIYNLPPNEDQVLVDVQVTPGTTCGSLSKIKVANGHFRYSIHCVSDAAPAGQASKECNTVRSALGLAAEWGRPTGGALDVRAVCGSVQISTTATWGDPGYVMNQWRPTAPASTNGIDCIVDEWRGATIDGGWSGTCSLALVGLEPIMG